MTIVILETNKGPISIQLDEEKAPLTAQNFLNYVNAGFYNDTIFHRVIPGFMIQGGGLTADMVQKTTQAPVMNEANNGLRNEIGTIAMARTSDPHSATAQFFINVANNDFLNYQSPSMQGFGYCVFGKVIDGMDVVNEITKVNTVNRAGHENVPEHAITITSARILQQATERSTAAINP